jgi:hypothetical protein
MDDLATVQKPSLGSSGARRRKRLLLIALIVLTVGLLAASFYFLVYWQDIQLQRALAETDQRDPGWRLLELEANRAVVPEEQNSAVILVAANKLLPATWPAWDKPYAPENKGRDPKASTALKESLWKLAPPAQLNEQQSTALREELTRAAAALAEARKVADLPHGRYSFRYTPKDNLSASPLHAIATHPLATLLAYDVLLRAHDRDVEGALTSCRAILNTTRALGDEPLPYSMSQRMLLDHLALEKMERTLAQGEPSEASLAAAQQLLEDEAVQPLFLIAARGARGMQDTALGALQDGEVSINQLWHLLGLGKTPFASGWDEMMMRTQSVKTARTALLRFNNEIVDIAKRPAEEQRLLLQQLAKTQSQLPRLVQDAPSDVVDLADLWHLNLAWMRTAIVMVAVERYRRAHQHWPESFTDLVPIYVATVPTDPYDGAPVRFRRFAEGVVVYSVGEDSQDNGGNVGLTWKPGTDTGWRLWDVQHRRQPPGK